MQGRKRRSQGAENGMGNYERWAQCKFEACYPNKDPSEQVSQWSNHLRQNQNAGTIYKHEELNESKAIWKMRTLHLEVWTLMKAFNLQKHFIWKTHFTFAAPWWSSDRSSSFFTARSSSDNKFITNWNVALSAPNPLPRISRISSFALTDSCAGEIPEWSHYKSNYLARSPPPPFFWRHHMHHPVLLFCKVHWLVYYMYKY